MLLLLAAATAACSPDAAEQSLVRQCGVPVPQSARMTYAGDNRTLIVDSGLPEAKVQCALRWASGWPTANAVGVYTSRRYPSGPYDVPPELRRTPGGGSPAAGAAGLSEAGQRGGAEARQPVTQEARAAFRQAVDEYQIFVVPHCAPEEVQAYVAATADRDRALVRSLRGTYLAADYSVNLA